MTHSQVKWYDKWIYELIFIPSKTPTLFLFLYLAISMAFWRVSSKNELFSLKYHSYLLRPCIPSLLNIFPNIKQWYPVRLSSIVYFSLPTHLPTYKNPMLSLIFFIRSFHSTTTTFTGLHSNSIQLVLFKKKQNYHCTVEISTKVASTGPISQISDSFGNPVVKLEWILDHNDIFFQVNENSAYNSLIFENSLRKNSNFGADDQTMWKFESIREIFGNLTGMAAKNGSFESRIWFRR